MAKLDRNGVSIHYEVHGSGPTILLSHGYSSTARMWDGQIAALKDRYQVIVAVPGDTPDALVDDLKRKLQTSTDDDPQFGGRLQDARVRRVDESARVESRELGADARQIVTDLAVSEVVTHADEDA